MEDFPQAEYKAYTPGTRHQTQDHEDLWSLSHYKRTQRSLQLFHWQPQCNTFLLVDFLTFIENLINTTPGQPYFSH